MATPAEPRGEFFSFFKFGAVKNSKKAPVRIFYAAREGLKFFRFSDSFSDPFFAFFKPFFVLI